ncbi:MAG TPA: hypothetical protein EYG89_03400 [Bacteroidia bacterium]|nr:hypothetical protein [Bacteroidia bacterium]
MKIINFEVPDNIDFLKMNIISDNNKYKIGVGDIEAYLNDDDEFIFKLGVIFDGHDFFTAWSVEEMFQIMHFSKIKKFYFHNLNFDFVFFLREYFIGHDVTMIQSGNMILSVKVGQFTFLNSLSLLPMSLKNVVNKYLKVSWEEWENEKSNVLDLEEHILEEYCRRDCFLTYSAVLKFTKMINENYGISKFLTIPSLALKVMNKKYIDKDIHQRTFNIKNSSPFFNVGYYFGGHTEKFINFRYKYENVNYYDVNSLYPSVMKDLYVNEGGFKMVIPNMANILKNLKNDTIFYVDCDIFVDREDLRIFPTFDEKKKSNFYKFGINRVKISDISLKYIYEMGLINNIVKIHGIVECVSKVKNKIFEKFVTDNYSKRKSDVENDIIYKLFLNGLYGKYGQKRMQDNYILNPLERIESKSMVSHGENFLHQTEGELSKYSLKYSRFDIAGRITESARILMSGYRREIKKHGGEIYYQDTDSIQGNFDLEKIGLGHLYCNKTLGLLKKENEKEGLLKGNIIGQKVYCYNYGFSASKGVKRMFPLDYERLALSMVIRNVIKGKTILKWSAEGEPYNLSLFPKNFFYNTRFTQTKTFLNKGFFGVQIVPHYITNLRERIDGLNSNKKVEKLDKIFRYLFKRYLRNNTL